MKEMGYDERTGLTLEGQSIDYKTGLPRNAKEPFTGPFKESLQISIFAKVLDGDKRAQVIYSKKEALDILKKKVNTLSAFSSEYPGYGGFFPWFKINSIDVLPATFSFTHGLSADENAQLFWSLFGLA